MSQRYEVQYNGYHGKCLIYDSGTPIDLGPVCKILNKQAEQLEVLRETVRDYVPNDIIQFWREVASGDCSVYNDIRETVKSRIAALEGKSPEIPGISST